MSHFTDIAVDSRYNYHIDFEILLFFEGEKQ